MNLSHFLGVLLGLWALGSGLYLAAIRPDPPPAARTATRTSRGLIGVAAIVVGLFNIYIHVVP